MMECTPESGRCHSVYSVGASIFTPLSKDRETPSPAGPHFYDLSTLSPPPSRPPQTVKASPTTEEPWTLDTLEVMQSDRATDRFKRGAKIFLSVDSAGCNLLFSLIVKETVSWYQRDRCKLYFVVVMQLDALYCSAAYLLKGQCHDDIKKAWCKLCSWVLIRLDTLFYSDNSKGLYNDNNTGRKLFSRKK
jgi:hypothetical protein